MVSATKGLDPIRTAVAVLLAIAVEVWTVRIGVRAGRDGLAIVRPFSTQRLPAESIRSLHVVRTNFAWYKVIDLQVRLADGTAVMVPWVSWGTQLDQLMTVEPPPLPRLSQQRVLDALAAGLQLDGAEAPPDPSK